MTRHIALGLMLSALMACQSTPDTVDEPLPNIPQAPTNDGYLRLSADVVAPTRYTLDLNVDPRQETFSGTVSIEIDIKAATSTIQLHGGDLTIKEASYESGAKVALSAEVGENGGLALSAPEALPPGQGVLTLSFEGGLGEVPESLYRVQDNERWYAYTQFEPLEARDAFPCFDDPGFKTPFKMSLTVPSEMTALGNTPEVGRVVEGDVTRFEFAETKPLPTYLVAMAIGEFDVVEAPTDAIPNVPLRLITTKGKGHLAPYALKITPPILAALERYFDSPYPYAKLDLVAVPNFSAGAMENVGLVTYRERLLLVEEDKAPVRTRYACQSVTAHELAHMWFGNLVTMAWWDDLWLNEAFATWMATRIISEVAPELEAPLDAINSAHRVMSTDAQSAARAIRQPIEHGGDVYNAFDGITYVKGAAVLRMMETWSGPEAFRDGVRAYLKANTFGTATTEDLLSALEASTGKPIRGSLGTFIDQPGTPLLDVQTHCKEGKASVTLTQTRYKPTGSQAPDGTPWHVPVCMRTQVNDQVGRTCVELTEPSQTFDLDVGGCLSWLHPNADEKGYYRWRLSPEDTVALVTANRQALTLPERVALPSHLSALLEAGMMDARTYMKGLEALSEEEHRIIVRGVVSNLGFLDRRGVPEAQREAFQVWARGLIAPHLERIGAEPRPGESAETGMLRPALLSAMANMVEDKATKAMLAEAAEAFFKDPASVRPDLASLALSVSAKGGDEALWVKLTEALPKAPTPQARGAIMSALGHFSEPELLRRSFGLLLDGTLRAQDFWSIMGPSFRSDATHAVMWEWMTNHYDALLKVLGDKRAPSLPWTATGFCSAEGRQATADFFSDSARRPPGTDRNLSQALERIERCARLREAVRPEAEAFFKARK